MTCGGGGSGVLLGGTQYSGGSHMSEAPKKIAIDPNLIGDNAPSVLPSEDPAILGRATLHPLDPVQVRTYQTHTLEYVVGPLGLMIRAAFELRGARS